MPPRCLNKDFDGVPEYLTHQFIQYFDNGTEQAFPHMVLKAGDYKNNPFYKVKESLSVCFYRLLVA